MMIVYKILKYKQRTQLLENIQKRKNKDKKKKIIIVANKVDKNIK